MLALSVAVLAHAETYSFDRFLRGGAGRDDDPAKQRTMLGAGAHVCLDVSSAAAGGATRVHFTIWSEIPEPYSKIVRVAIDVGRHSNLVSGFTISAQSPGANFVPIPPAPHAFLPSITPAFTIRAKGPDYVAGLAPGKFVTVAASLGAGRSLGDVLGALRQGTDPASGSTGLRVAVIAHHLLGKAPTRATISDDGGFVTTRVTTQCRRRPVKVI